MSNRALIARIKQLEADYFRNKSRFDSAEKESDKLLVEAIIEAQSAPSASIEEIISAIAAYGDARVRERQDRT